MTHIRLKLSIASLVIAGAVGYLAFAGAQKGWVYTLGVDQFLASPQQHSLRVRLCGKVSDQNLEVRKAGLLASFSLVGEKNSIRVIYKGVIPDMFKAGSEVIVEGKRDPAGTFQADILMTKCASKYEEGAPPPNHPPVQHDTQSGAQP
jgi:cytochrome c-type biogenesis protein CcmE